MMTTLEQKMARLSPARRKKVLENQSCHGVRGTNGLRSIYSHRLLLSYSGVYNTHHEKP